MNPNEVVKMIADSLTSLGILVAFAYFLFRVFVQKFFQRMTIELTARRVKNGSPIVEIQCKITNKSEVRVDFDVATISVSRTAETAESTHLGTDLPLDNNIDTSAVPVGPIPAQQHGEPAQQHSESDYDKIFRFVGSFFRWLHQRVLLLFAGPAHYSVDAQSTTQLCKLFNVPLEVDVITVKAKLLPRWTSDKYLIERTFYLDVEDSTKLGRSTTPGE